MKSPVARPVPNWSPVSAWSLIPGVSWVKNWLLAEVRPFTEPSSTFTAPASTIVPTSSKATPTARSA